MNQNQKHNIHDACLLKQYIINISKHPLRTKTNKKTLKWIVSIDGGYLTYKDLRNLPMQKSANNGCINFNKRTVLFLKIKIVLDMMKHIQRIKNFLSFVECIPTKKDFTIFEPFKYRYLSDCRRFGVFRLNYYI